MFWCLSNLHTADLFRFLMYPVSYHICCGSQPFDRVFSIGLASYSWPDLVLFGQTSHPTYWNSKLHVGTQNSGIRRRIFGIPNCIVSCSKGVQAQQTNIFLGAPSTPTKQSKEQFKPKIWSRQGTTAPTPPHPPRLTPWQVLESRACLVSSFDVAQFFVGVHGALKN